MSEVTAQVAALVDTLATALPEIGAASTAGYGPLVDCDGVALVATALGHQDEGYNYSAGWMHVIHRVPLEFWLRFDVGDPEPGIVMIRNIGYRAMRALVAHDGTGGYALATGGASPVFSGAVDSTPVTVAPDTETPWLRYRLSVAVFQKEAVE